METLIITQSKGGSFPLTENAAVEQKSDNNINME